MIYVPYVRDWLVKQEKAGGGKADKNKGGEQKKRHRKSPENTQNTHKM